jgi:hypothetical protein
MTSHTSGCICIQPFFQHVASTQHCSNTVNLHLIMSSPPPKVLLFDIGGVCVSHLLLPSYPLQPHHTNSPLYRSYPPSQPSSPTSKKTPSPSAGSTPQSLPPAKPAHGQNSNAAKSPSTPLSSLPSPRTSATSNYGGISTSSTFKRLEKSQQHKQQRKQRIKSHNHRISMEKNCIGI